MIKSIFCLLVILYFVQSSHGENQGELQDQNQVENTKDLLNRDAREAGSKKTGKSGRKNSKRQNRKKGGKPGKNSLKNQRKKNEKKNNIRRPGRKSTKRQNRKKGGKPGKTSLKNQKKKNEKKNNIGRPGRKSSKRQKKGGKPGKNSLKRQRKKKEGKSEKKNSKIQKKKKLRKPGTKHSKNPKGKKVGKPGKNSSKRQRKKKARKSGKKSLKSQRGGTQTNIDTNCKGDNPTGGSYPACLQNPSAFTCQIYWYSRAGSLARTESNRAKGTQRFIRKIENAISKKNTRYTEIIRALNMSTNNGTTCKGTTASSNVTEIYKGLINCNKTIPEHCQTSDVTGYEELKGELDNGTCSPMLEKYSTDYKYCLFRLSEGANSKVCKCFLNTLEASTEAAAAVPSYPFTKSVETQYTDIYKYRIDTLDTFRCLPKPFTSVWNEAKTQWRTICNNAGVTGSWGYCNAKLREAIQYVECGGANGCRTAGCTTPGETNTTTAASTTATVATTGSVTTAPSGRRYNLQNRLKRFLET